MNQSADKDIYDLIIIGAGPAGFTASIYATRYKLRNVVIGKLIGGLAGEAHKICNYPSEKEISGMDLVNKMRESVENQGGKIITDEVVSVQKIDNGFEVLTAEKKEFRSKAILIASGTEHRKLDLPNEHKFVGKGVSYCATCDAMFYRNADIAVIGGSDAALTASLYLADIAKTVYLIYRGNEFRGDPTWIDQVAKKPNIKIALNTNVVELMGTQSLEEIRIDNPLNGNKKIEIKGLFVEIGSEPKIETYSDLGLKYDESKYINVDKEQSTNISGIWAAGDITNGSNGFRQIITASSEGAIAAESIYKHIRSRT
jgi:thioredoxin reductase (NADPH)